MKELKQMPLELVFWVIALVALALLNPSVDAHISLCPLENIGFTWCPGCGLGRSIHLFLNGQFTASWTMHPLGGFAFMVILYRIFELIKHIKTIRKYG